MLAYLTVCCTCSGSDARLIRRLYLDSTGMPPTIEEIEWYTIYNRDGYKIAVDWVISYTNTNMRDYYLKEEYKNNQPVEIPQNILNNIIKYQVGNLKYTNKQAELKMIEFGGNLYTDPLDIIDYFSLNMMARVTHIDEANLLLRVFRSFKNETEGYLEVISLIKEFRDFRYK